MVEKRTLNRKKLLAFSAGILVGACVFILLYGTAVLDVTWDSWILNFYDESDIQQHYAGWLLFRNSHWGFPLGLADTIAAPDGTIISYTDSIPWVSIFFKAIRAFLPPTFQWFGWYIFVCFCLQGGVGALLTCRRIWGGTYGEILSFSLRGAALFSCLPTLWERAFRHTALASQFLFLTALYVYLECRGKYQAGQKAFPWQFAVLAFLSVGIHPYFLPLVCICSLGTLIDEVRYLKKIPAAVGQFVLTICAALGGGILCGAISPRVSPSRGGYGYYSMNLNAPYTPLSCGMYRWSQFLPKRTHVLGQYDGFNYLGLGILALTALSLAYAAVRAFQKDGRLKTWWRRNGVLFGICVFLTLFAVSNKIYWDDKGFEIPLPNALLDLCGIFRASSRMFYLVGACILLFGIYSVMDFCAEHGKTRSFAASVLTVILLVQVMDLSSVIVEKRLKTEPFVEIVPTVATDIQTQFLGGDHTQLLITSAEGDLRRLAVLAGKQGLTTNISIANSGDYPGAAKSMEEAQTLLAGGDYDPQTVYVTHSVEQYEIWRENFHDDPNVQMFKTYSDFFFLVPLPATDKEG